MMYHTFKLCEQELFWDATYAIVLALMEHYPTLSPEEVGLHQLTDLVINLPTFQDDPDLVNQQLLEDILKVWYEEKAFL